MAGRFKLEKRIAGAAAVKHGLGKTLRPPHWIGWRVAPLRIEFYATGLSACMTGSESASETPVLATGSRGDFIPSEPRGASLRADVRGMAASAKDESVPGREPVTADAREKPMFLLKRLTLAVAFVAGCSEGAIASQTPPPRRLRRSSPNVVDIRMRQGQHGWAAVNNLSPAGVKKAAQLDQSGKTYALGVETSPERPPPIRSPAPDGANAAGGRRRTSPPTVRSG